MKAIVIDAPGDASQLRLADVPDPQPQPDELLIRVHATALNRADILQRQGLYPPPPGASDIPGLELAGEVVAIGAAVRRFHPGDRVYGLSGGGYAQLATLPESLAMPIPDRFDFLQAASLPEVFFTANEALITLGRLQAGGRALVHAGGSGVGIAAIQIGTAIGAEVLVTAGSDAKCARARDLGAALAINYKSHDFVEAVKEHTQGRGVDVLLDVVGASYFDRNLRSLAPGGRLILVGMLGGARSEIDLGYVLRRRLQIIGTVLRSRSLEERAAITRRYQEQIEPLLIAGQIVPIIDRLFPLRDAAAAHRYMEADKNFGKIVLDVAGGV